MECAYGSNRADDVRRPWPTVIHNAGFLATASGRLVLADRPELLEALRSRSLPRLTRYTATGWGHLARSVDAARGDRLAVENEQSLLGYNCLAAGVYGRDGTLVGAVGVVGRTGAFVAERLRRPVREAAAQLSLIMAAAPPDPGGR
ncbi:IclR family transcriptional regulator C-terminal domain-containing protein [Dactylosporangium cerinum]|uniref:IclR family transcriptional regulator C-terminal domain-containing protein n=1 Tax=Dactylosporangium cerinum TaxID=1434730 RepID=A0ABV9VWJ5_9ACTN